MTGQFSDLMPEQGSFLSNLVEKIHKSGPYTLQLQLVKRNYGDRRCFLSKGEDELVFDNVRCDKGFYLDLETQDYLRTSPPDAVPTPWGISAIKAPTLNIRLTRKGLDYSVYAQRKPWHRKLCDLGWDVVHSRTPRAWILRVVIPLAIAAIVKKLLGG